MAMTSRARIVRAAATLGVASALAAASPASADRPSPGGSAPDDRWLALRFRPLLHFDARERWRPLDVDRFLAEPGHAACPPATVPPAPPTACVPLTSAAQLTAAVDHLDLRGDGPPDPPGARSVIYANVTRRGARVAIDYWWFLRHNAFGIASHEGDWEGVTVIADRFGRRVLAVHFAQHAHVWRYPRTALRLRGRRVAVVVARGGHASYPRRCVRACRQTDGIAPEARADGRRPWAGNRGAVCRGRCVRLMPTGADGAPASWNGWRGRWGITRAPAFAAPLTPAFQPRFQRPFAARRVPRSAL